MLIAGCASYNRIDYETRKPFVYVGESASLFSQDGRRTLGWAEPGDTIWILGELRDKGTGELAHYITLSLGERARVPDSLCMTLEDYAQAVADGELSGSAEHGGSATGTGHVLHTGPRGGTYYINSNGKKTYVKKGGSSKSSGKRK